MWLTILPRLNSLNHEPGVSFGQLDILTYQKQNEKREQMFARVKTTAACQQGRMTTRPKHRLKTHVIVTFTTCLTPADFLSG